MQSKHNSIEGFLNKYVWRHNIYHLFLEVNYNSNNFSIIWKFNLSSIKVLTHKLLLESKNILEINIFDTMEKKFNQMIEGFNCFKILIKYIRNSKWPRVLASKNSATHAMSSNFGLKRCNSYKNRISLASNLWYSPWSFS